MPIGDKRTQIMTAAERLFTSRRFHEITLDDIAREAKVGKGTIYTHFRDKNDLFFQVATSGLDDLCDRLLRRVSGDAPFERQLRESCDEICAFFSSRRELFRMIQSEEARMALSGGELRERWMHRRRKLVEALAGVMRRGMSSGLVRSDIHPELLANLLLGMLRSLARNADNGAVTPQGHTTLLDVFINGAGAGKARPSMDAGGKTSADSRSSQ